MMTTGAFHTPNTQRKGRSWSDSQMDGPLFSFTSDRLPFLDVSLLPKKLEVWFLTRIFEYERSFQFLGRWQDVVTKKKAGFLFSVLNAGSSFISQDEVMSESPVETIEKALGLHLFWTGASHPFDTSRGAGSSMLQKVTMPESSW